MSMIKYKFKNRMNGLISEGYMTLRVVNGIVEIDGTDPNQAQLVKSLGGKPLVVISEGKPESKGKKVTK